MKKFWDSLKHLYNAPPDDYSSAWSRYALKQRLEAGFGLAGPPLLAGVIAGAFFGASLPLAAGVGLAAVPVNYALGTFGAWNSLPILYLPMKLAGALGAVAGFTLHSLLHPHAFVRDLKRKLQEPTIRQAPQDLDPVTEKLSARKAANEFGEAVKKAPARQQRLAAQPGSPPTQRFR